MTKMDYCPKKAVSRPPNSFFCIKYKCINIFGEFWQVALATQRFQKRTGAIIRKPSYHVMSCHVKKFNAKGSRLHTHPKNWPKCPCISTLEEKKSLPGWQTCSMIGNLAKVCQVGKLFLAIVKISLYRRC